MDIRSRADQIKNDQNISPQEKIEKFKKIYDELSDDDKEKLVDQLIKNNECFQSEGQDEKDKTLQKLMILELNRCFYNDQHMQKVCYFCDSLNRVFQGFYNFIEILQIDDDKTPLTLHPIVVGIKLYFEELLQEPKGNDETKKIYSKPSSLPVVVFINLDGFDNPLNLEVVKNFPTFNYFSIFHEFFNPDGIFSFYKYIKQKKEILKSFFPFFTPFYKHVQEYYNEKAKSKKYPTQYAEEKLKEKLDSLYKGVISDEEFAYLFEEYIIYRLNEYSKVDALVFSYTCVMSPDNKRTEQIFRLTEETFFNIFTHIARRTNFRMIFLPRLIIRTLKSPSELPQKITLPYQLLSQLEQKEMDQKLEQNLPYFKRAQQELKMYEQQIRETFGIYQFCYEQKNQKKRYENENFALVKYIQNITCGFFQLFNSLNILKQRQNTSIFTQKKNILHWRFVQSTVFMQNRIQEIKNKDYSRNNGLGAVKKESAYLIKYLKEVENTAIQNLSDKSTLEFQREYLRSLELIDCIFLFQHNDKIEKGKIAGFIQEDEVAVKKFKIKNSMNKSCFLNKYSQFYVDYKNKMVYFFNILYPADQSMPKQYDDLVFIMTNCVGYIPRKDSLEDEIQVYKICDWKFSRITLGLQDEMQKHRQYFLQNATIICSTKKLKDQNNKQKFKFLLFFGGEINYYDKNKKEINLQSEHFIKNTCLYCLKIGQESASRPEVVYSFEEIKIFGVKEDFIQNLSYSSGISITYLEQKDQIKQTEENKQKQQNKQPDSKDQGGTDKQNKQQTNKVKEPSDNMEDYSQKSYLFIFGGEYSSSKEQCTLQNVILFCDIDDVLNQLIQESNNKLQDRQNLEFHKSKSISSQLSQEFLKIKYLEQNEERILRENTNLLEQIDIKLAIQQKDYIKKVQIYLLELNQTLTKILKEIQIDEQNKTQLSNISDNEQILKEMILNQCKNSLNIEQWLLIYQKALCHKILGQNKQAQDFFSNENIMAEICQFDRKNVTYYLSHLAVTGNLEINDKTLIKIRDKCQDLLKLGKEDKQFLNLELESVQCKYLNKEQASQKKLLDYVKKLEEFQRDQYFTNQYVGNQQTICQKLADAYFILYKREDSKDQKQKYYKQALGYFEQIRTIPYNNRQNVSYVINMQQIPKQQLVHLDSIKSINKRKAFKIKPTDKSQYIQKLDTRILLIGGTSSKYQNYSDSNKIENAHFFYPVLYLNYYCSQKQNQLENQNKEKVDIKPENGFIQRIDLNQQFSPHQIASLNHNYIVQQSQKKDKILEVIETKKNQNSQAQTQIENPKQELAGNNTEFPKAKDQKTFPLDQIQLEIRILESSLIDSKSYFYNKKADEIYDEDQNQFQFQQTFKAISEQKQNQDLSAYTQLIENLNTSTPNAVLSEQEILKKLQQTPAVYENKDDIIEIKDRVDLGLQLNKCQIKEHQQNQAQQIQKMQNNIYAGKDQRFYGCFYTSLSVIFETIFLKQNENFYQNKREKPKTKSYFWEIMKQFNKTQANQTEKEIQSTLKSLDYEQKHTQIIFLQKQAKCLLSSGLDKFSKWSVHNQTAHQNETDIYMNIFWRYGSSKLIMYDHEIQRVIQVQMLIHSKKLNKALVPNENQIRYVFYNNKDQHVYICIEEEFSYKFQNVLMRTPLQNIKHQYSEIIFEEQINKHDPLLNKITFTINSKDKIFGIIQENLNHSNELHTLNHNTQQKWILENNTSPNLLNVVSIIQSFQTVKDTQISHLLYLSKFSSQRFSLQTTELQQIPLQLAILGRQIEIQELNNQRTNLFKFLEEKIKNTNQDQNDKEKSQFQYISTVTKGENNYLNQSVIQFLCNPSVFSLIKSSFNSLVLGHTIYPGDLSLFSQLDYRIQFLDISKITNIKEVVQEFLKYLEKRGHFLKYLNISGQTPLFNQLTTDKNISFSQLIYLDISNTTLKNKQKLIEFIQNLLNSCIRLQGINIYQMKREGNPQKYLLKFQDLFQSTFTSTFMHDYDLHIYIEKELSMNFQNNEDTLLMTLESQFGKNHQFIPEDKRQYQKLNVKSKSRFELDFQSDRIERLIVNNLDFKDPIVFSTETRYLIFERNNTLIEEKKCFIMKFYHVIQSEQQKIQLESIQKNESISIQFKTQVFKELIILNISKLQNDEGEKFTIFGIMKDNYEKAYICKMCLPVTTSTEISQDKIKMYKSRSNIKKFSNQWMQDCFLPIYHNKKVKDTYLCVKDSYQVEGYSFFNADEQINLEI
ncbi:hypothetical protein ABPG73_003297 [Tetrahymena malaccensis]